MDTNEHIWHVDVSNLSPEEAIRVVREFRDTLGGVTHSPHSPLWDTLGGVTHSPHSSDQANSTCDLPPPEPLTEQDILGKRKLDL